MKFVFENNRSSAQQIVFGSAARSIWQVSDVFTEGAISDFEDEETRLKWSPVLASLAFGEATAFAGFGGRIAEAADLSTKSWLTVHLLDECKHTEGFSSLLRYLYPSHEGKYEGLLQNRDVLVFYGRTHRVTDLLQWLISTQIAEIFGMHCYRALASKMKAEKVVANFLNNIVSDESRHLAYIGALIEERKKNLDASKWEGNYLTFADSMVHLARNMFEAKKCGPNFRSFESMGIDVSSFCDDASSALEKRFMGSI